MERINFKENFCLWTVQSTQRSQPGMDCTAKLDFFAFPRSNLRARKKGETLRFSTQTDVKAIDPILRPVAKSQLESRSRGLG